LEAGKRQILFGADTAYGRHFQSVGKVDLACMGIGAYNPYQAAHATPEQALKMADDVGADFILPMHHSTFKLSYEPMGEPIERLMGAVGRDEGRVAVREVGGQWALP
jgi:L-ascorbate metabolism protein UlaG (beta-lactamase superfamily)